MAQGFSHGASALSRVTLARSQRNGRATWTQQVSHCIARRGAAPAIVLPHEQLPTASQRTAQLSSTATLYVQQASRTALSSLCVSADRGHLCSP